MYPGILAEAVNATQLGIAPSRQVMCFKASPAVMACRYLTRAMGGTYQVVVDWRSQLIMQLHGVIAACLHGQEGTKKIGCSITVILQRTMLEQLNLAHSMGYAHLHRGLQGWQDF